MFCVTLFHSFGFDFQLIMCFFNHCVGECDKIHEANFPLEPPLNIKPQIVVRCGQNLKIQTKTSKIIHPGSSAHQWRLRPPVLCHRPLIHHLLLLRRGPGVPGRHGPGDQGELLCGHPGQRHGRPAGGARRDHHRQHHAQRHQRQPADV